MSIPSPFHERTEPLCVSYRWKDWAGYHAVCAYDTYAEREYFAFRHAAGVIDVTPLFKYEVRGRDAERFLSYVIARDIGKLKPDQVSYCCWCDERGKLLDDGTVWRLADDHYRVTAAEPSLAWFHQNAVGFAVTIEDCTSSIAALSIQGPNSRAVLNAAVGDPIDDLKFFRLRHATINGFDAVITRTGYTGDLGYEVWVENKHAIGLWDALFDAGEPFGLLPCGLDALDVTRVEAGFIMNGVDYYSANHCLIDSRMSTPYETGLGWTVKLDRDPFIGQASLKKEKQAGPERRLVCLELDWDEFELLFASHGLPPEVCSSAWRTAVPVYSERGSFIGQATSGSWSPMLKKNLALATVNSPHGKVGETLKMEVTVEYRRHKVRAKVIKKPAFDPPRKKA